MNKQQQVVSEYLMGIVDNFDERYGGLGQEIREFLSSSNRVKKAIKEAYYEQNEKILSYIDNAPDEFYEKAKELHQEVFVDSSAIRIDLEREFFYRMASKLEEFPNEFVEELVKEGSLQMIFFNSKESFLSEIEEIIREIASDNVESFLNALYHDYVPEDVPERLIEEIRMIFGEGATFIPVTAIFPIDEESDEDCAE